MDICAYKHVNAVMRMFVIHEQVQYELLVNRRQMIFIEGECNSLSCNGDAKCLVEQQRKKLLTTPCPEGNLFFFFCLQKIIFIFDI